MQLHLALQDGFEDDEVVIGIDGDEAYRDRVTTRTQISHAADMRFDVPDRPVVLEVDVPTQGVRGSFTLDPRTQSNVAISLREGRLVAAYPERLGFA